MLPPFLIGIDFNFMCNSPHTGCSSFHWFDCYWFLVVVGYGIGSQIYVAVQVYDLEDTPINA